MINDVKEKVGNIKQKPKGNFQAVWKFPFAVS
jgi:hypothetical protein